MYSEVIQMGVKIFECQLETASNEHLHLGFARFSVILVIIFETACHCS